MDLAGHLQKVPQEIYDRIWELTFSTALESDQVLVNEKYKPPSCLQVNRNLRQKLAETYYSAATFRVEIWNCWSAMSLFRDWLNSIPEEHRRLLRHVIVYQSAASVAEAKQLMFTRKLMTTFMRSGLSWKWKHLNKDIMQFELSPMTQDIT